jgi:SAM-dependent methyltransferase
MTVADAVHGRLVHPRRVRVLAAHAARLLPRDATVLDVGTGDGQLACAVRDSRPDLRIEGIDVLVRDRTPLPVEAFDGCRIPRPSRSVDAVTFFDVLHHGEDPMALLREGVRVARRCVVIKDHVSDTPLASRLLRFMDTVGNARHGVALPHHYWTTEQWRAAIAELRLVPKVWLVDGLGLYPWPASLVFGSRLHVLARLDVAVES